MARAHCEILRRDGAGALVEASQGQFEMMLMQNLFKLGEKVERTPEEWQAWGKALTAALAGRKTVEAMREEFGRKAAAAARPWRRRWTRRSRTRGVVDRVREILGV
jgi:hypothetical protein